MAFRLRYQVNIDYVDSPGLGTQSVVGPGFSAGATAGPSIRFYQIMAPGSSTFTASDVTNLLNSMNTDLSAQLNANLTRIANFASGGG